MVSTDEVEDEVEDEDEDNKDKDEDDMRKMKWIMLKRRKTMM